MTVPDKILNASVCLQEVNLTLWQLGNDWTSAAREIMSNHK